MDLFSKRLLYLIQSSGLNQSGFSRAIGTASQNINAALKGRRELSDELIDKICLLWPGVTYEWLKRGNGEPPILNDKHIVEVKKLMEPRAEYKTTGNQVKDIDWTVFDIGQRLLYVRKQLLNKSVAVLSKELGLTGKEMSYYVYEYNRVKPEKEFLNRLQQVFGINPDFIMKGALPIADERQTIYPKLQEELNNFYEATSKTKAPSQTDPEANIFTIPLKGNRKAEISLPFDLNDDDLTRIIPIIQAF